LWYKVVLDLLHLWFSLFSFLLKKIWRYAWLRITTFNWYGPTKCSKRHQCHTQFLPREKCVVGVDSTMQPSLAHSLLSALSRIASDPFMQVKSPTDRSDLCWELIGRRLVQEMVLWSRAWRNGGSGPVEHVAVADEASVTTPNGGRRSIVPSHRYELIFIGSWQCEAGNREMERPAVVEWILDTIPCSDFPVITCRGNVEETGRSKFFKSRAGEQGAKYVRQGKRSEGIEE
jgi:hypothetical protein